MSRYVKVVFYSGESIKGIYKDLDLDITDNGVEIYLKVVVDNKETRIPMKQIYAFE